VSEEIGRHLITFYVSVELFNHYVLVRVALLIEPENFEIFDDDNLKFHLLEDFQIMMNLK
jgi:hypothetical protein